MQPSSEAEYAEYLAGRLPRLHRAAYLLCGDRHRAEDLVQHAAGPQGRDGLRQTLTTLDHDLDHPTATIHRVVGLAQHLGAGRLRARVMLVGIVHDDVDPRAAGVLA